jgi:hypothetical protein
MDVLVATAGAVYVVAMALVFGGTAALSFATAPQVFRALKAVDAGRVFGRVLRVFDGMAWVAAMAAVVAGVVRMAERVTAPAVAMVVVAAAVQILVTLLRRSVAPQMAELKPPETEEQARAWDPEKRRRFEVLHQQYVRLYSANLFLALAGLVLAALPG